MNVKRGQVYIDREAEKNKKKLTVNRFFIERKPGKPSPSIGKSFSGFGIDFKNNLKLFIFFEKIMKFS